MGVDVGGVNWVDKWAGGWGDGGAVSNSILGCNGSGGEHTD